jgi:apolipoprotein N-acyltransferase
MLFGIAPLAVAWARLAESASHETPLRPLLLRAFFLGWLAQFILNAIGFHWISHTAIEFGHFPTWAGILVLIGFCAVAHLYYGLAGAAALYVFLKLKRKAKLRNTSLPITYLIALSFAFFALFEHLWPAIFPWHLGYTWLWADLPGVQVSDLIGFEGLNLISLLTNALFAIGWIKTMPLAETPTQIPTQTSTHRKRAFRNLGPALPWVGTALTVFFLINIFGLGRADSWRPTDAAQFKTLKIALIQGNIGNYEKLIVEKQKDFANPIIETYLRLSREAFAAHPDITHVLWPETAFPDYLDPYFQHEPNRQVIQAFAQSSGRTIFTGAYSYEPSRKQTFNGFFAMSSNGELLSSPYRKSILIPFGEKFPFSDIIPYMKWLFPGYGSFGQGDGPMAMDVVDFKLGPQICLESLYPQFAAKTARLGAEVLSNVTNDSWFGRTFEPYQHMTMTLARAIENRRPLLRATNTGITTVVLADGTKLQQSPIGKEWYGYYEVPYRANPPVVIYSRIAGYSPWLAAFLLVLIAALASRHVSRAKKA